MIFKASRSLHVHELMASHGIVTVVALHSANAIARVRDLPLVIDAMLARSADDGDPLFDTHRSRQDRHLGHLRGGSRGDRRGGRRGRQRHCGRPAHQGHGPLRAGRPDSYSLADASTIAIPYLIMGGTQNANGLAVPTLFDATVLATPRIRVLNPGAAHFSYIANMAAEIDQTREQALLANPDMPEPLTTLTASNAAAARAYEAWNWGEILFPHARSRCRQWPQLRAIAWA